MPKTPAQVPKQTLGAGLHNSLRTLSPPFGVLSRVKGQTTPTDRYRKILQQEPPPPSPIRSVPKTTGVRYTGIFMYGYILVIRGHGSGVSDTRLPEDPSFNASCAPAEATGRGSGTGQGGIDPPEAPESGSQVDQGNGVGV